MKKPKLLVYEKIIKIIDSCKNEEHFNITNVFIDLYMKMYNEKYHYIILNDSYSNFLKSYLNKKKNQLFLQRRVDLTV